jgi:small subunit ribosomal protein S16
LAVRIRLTRVGATKRPSYRVIAIDSRRPRDGRALEILGFYDPLTDPATVQLDAEKLNAWIGKGARPSDTVVKLMRQAGLAVPPGYEVVAPKPSATPAAKPAAKARSKKAAESATAAEAPPAEEAAAEESPAAQAPAEEAPAAEAPAADTAAEEAPAEEAHAKEAEA